MTSVSSRWLQKRLERSPLPPQRLCFELTETSALRDLSRAQNFIEAVRALGCRFALDDFGTGSARSPTCVRSTWTS